MHTCPFSDFSHLFFQDGFAVLPETATSNFIVAKTDKDWEDIYVLPGVPLFPTTKGPNMLSLETIRVKSQYANSLKLVSN